MTLPKKLFIPNKDMTKVNQPGYGTDMRTIEVFVNNNSGSVTEITTGTPGVLTITNPTGPVVNIDSTGGGGGGGSPALLLLNAGIEVGDVPFTMLPFTPSNPSQPSISYWEMWSNATGSIILYNIAASWMTSVNPGDSVNLLPILTAPLYTGSDIGVNLSFWASTFDFSNQALYTGGKLIPSGTTVQYATTDISGSINGADLSLVNGTGQSGNGLISSGGLVYWGGVAGYISVPTGVTFT
jgi:hypothetical protein